MPTLAIAPLAARNRRHPMCIPPSKSTKISATVTMRCTISGVNCPERGHEVGGDGGAHEEQCRCGNPNGVAEPAGEERDEARRGDRRDDQAERQHILHSGSRLGS